MNFPTLFAERPGHPGGFYWFACVPFTYLVTKTLEEMR
jgi:hypothetical protein